MNVAVATPIFVHHFFDIILWSLIVGWKWVRL